MDIRKALLTKLANCSNEELKDIIDDGITSKEESILPGLGVLFEVYYQSLSSKEQFINDLNQLL